MFHINRYTFVYEKDNILYLRGKSMEEIAVTDPNNQQFLYGLFQQQEDLDTIEKKIGENLTFKLLDENILVHKKLDYKTRFSRTDGYYSLFYGVDSRIFTDKTVLVLGAGALGTYISNLLVMYGVKNLLIVDYDIIEESNLNRQLLYSKSDVGKLKVEILVDKLRSFGSETNVIPISMKISSQDDLNKLLQIYSDIDLVIKAIDTPIQIIEEVNSFCVKNKISYISGGFNGTFALVDNIYIPDHTICFACRGVNIDDYAIYSEIVGPTIPEMPAILSGLILNIVANIFLDRVEDIFLNGLYVYDLKKQTLSKEKYEKLISFCDVCGKHNFLEKTSYTDSVKNIVFIVLLGFLISIILFLMKTSFVISQFVVLLIMFGLAVDHAIKRIPIYLFFKRISYFLFTFELFFILYNVDILLHQPIEITIYILVSLIMWILIFNGLSLVTYLLASVVSGGE